MREKPTGVVVVNEGDGARRPPAQQAGALAVRVPQPPVLALANGLIQDALGHEIEQANAASAIQPVAQRLAGAILVVIQALTPPAEETCHLWMAAPDF